MVVKVWDAGEYFVEYNIRPTARKYSFTDTTGRDVTMTELGFFDPWFVTEMGFTNKTEMYDWWLLNRGHEVFSEENVTSTLDNNLHYFFDHPALAHQSGLNNGMLDVENVLSYRMMGASGRTNHTVVLLNQGEGGDTKPTYRAVDCRWGGTMSLELKVATQEGTPSGPLPKHWSTKLNYTFRMDPTEFNFFRKMGKESNQVPFYGMELEVSTDVTTEELYRIVTEVEPKQEPFFIFKDDSSIKGNKGYKYELVTVPCSRKYLRDAWKKLFSKLEVLCKAKGKVLGDYFDVRTDLTNGIHIHVSKDKFYGDFHRRKFLTAFQQWDTRNVEFMTKVSGRPQAKFSDYTYCPLDERYVGRTLARRLKKGAMRGEGSRSVCHGNNSATIEVRLYQGVVNLDHILRCLDHTDAIFEFTNQVSLTVFGRDFVPKFEEFILKGSKYALIKKFIQGGYSQCA